MKCATSISLGSLIIAMAFLGAGCSSESPTDPEPPDEPSGAVATGFVYQISGAAFEADGPSTEASHGGAVGPAASFAGAEIRIFDAAGTAPAGATPVGGALLSAEDLAGNVVGSATADAAGAFRIGDLPAGLLTLQVRTGGAGSTPDGSLDFTAIARTTIALGRAYAVTREAAIAHATSGVPGGALVLGTLQPLPAGTRVRPDRDADASPRARTLSSDEWFFFVNPEPYSRLDHAVSYVFVDAASGAVARTDGVFSAPAANGTVLWDSDFDMARYTGIDFESFDPDNLPPNASATLTPELVQAPDELAAATRPSHDGMAFARIPARPGIGASRARGSAGAPSARLASLSPTAASESPDDVFTLAIQGMVGSDLAADFQNMSALFERIAPISSHRESMVYPHHTLEASGSEYRRRFNRLRDGIEERLRVGGKPLLVVFISSHGALDFETADPLPSYVQDHSNGQKINAGPASHLLTSARPCKLVVILDFCYALRFADELYDLYEALPEDQRPELEIYASCGSRETSKTFAYWQSWLPGTGEAGGVFTNAIRGLITVTPGGGFSGLLGPDGELLPELRTLASTGGTQKPQVRKLSGDPTWCKALLTASQTALDFTHNETADPLPHTIGTVTLSNGSTLPVMWSVSTGHFSIEAEPSGGTIPPNGTVDVTLRYIGDATSPFSTSVVFTAEESGGSRTTSVSIPLSADIETGVVVREFEISAPLGPLAGRLYELFIPIGAGAKVDSTKLIDLTTNQPPASIVWPAAPFVTYHLTYEGPRLEGEYGIRFRFENNTLDTCPFDVCGPRMWRYTVWYSKN